MSATRHWFAQWDHGEVAVQAHVVWTAESADEHRANGWRVEGPFVPEASPGAVSISREEALWIIGQIQGDTSPIATSVRAAMLAYLTGSSKPDLLAG